MNKNDKIRGSLIGGAAGDALGYAVEFCSLNHIINKYGERGITHYNLVNGTAQISDDTQMTLFTANGILSAITRFARDGKQGSINEYIAGAYDDWFLTQTHGETGIFNGCWIRNVKELNSSRAPGTTCMSALAALNHKTTVQNNSKGCGGVMRVAPVALYYAVNGNASLEEVMKMGGDAARITHLHPLGYLPAALMSGILFQLIKEEHTSASQLEQTIQQLLDTLRQVYRQEKESMGYLSLIVEKAIELSHKQLPDVAAIIRLGEGWVGEEALAIAIYCTLKHFNDFEAALIAAVNHSGDSDSTGAVCGNIMGAIVGYKAVPDHFIQNLELHNLIISIADDLFTGCPINNFSDLNTPNKVQWEKRYCQNIVCGI